MGKIQKAIQNPGDVPSYLKTRFKYRVDKPYMRPIDRRIGNSVLGMPVETQKHLFGELALKRARFRSDYQPTPNERAEDLKRNEYVGLGNPHDEDLIETIQAKFDEVIENEDATRVRGEVDGEIYARGILHDELFERIPEVSQLVTEDIKEVIEGYYGSYFQILRGSFYRTKHVPQEVVERTEVFNDYWHVDGRTTDHLKLFVLFSETTEKDGPMHLIPKDESKRMVELNNGFDRKEDGVPGRLIEQNAQHIEKFTGEPGTTMIGNTQKTLHRAGHPEPGRQRDMLMFYITPSDTSLSENWHEEDIISPSDGRLSRLLAY